ncbi:MAG: type II toxin-antitoxin system RelE/ParE family toxin [Planctomycetes bacterium]|nr:type II toxin-antitoxin system RelE/ParE family toxin [Planctomycetota bacterium]
MPIVKLSAEATADYQQAFDWYELQQPGVGDKFKACLLSMLDIIARFPSAFPEIDPGTRKAVLTDYPFIVLYQTRRDAIYVTAVGHASREPLF